MGALDYKPCVTVYCVKSPWYIKPSLHATEFTLHEGAGLMVPKRSETALLDS